MNNHINFQHISNRIKLAENNHNWMTLNCQLIMVECYYTQKQMYRGLRLKVFSVMFSGTNKGIVLSKGVTK